MVPTIAANRSPTPTRRSGRYTAVLTVTDDAGRTDTDDVDVFVGANGPTAAFTLSPTGPVAGQNVSFNASGSTAGPGRTIVSYAWDFGDGTTGSGQTVTKTGGYAAPGTYTVTLVVVDDQGNRGVRSKTVIVNLGSPVLSVNPRIEELRRRVQADPASIAFAALAEEYRRVGHYTDAIETCIAGLKRHPSYVSARVTLGRALIEVGRFDEAEQELQLVLKAAPENLAAIRGLADIHHRRPDQGYDELSKLAQHAANEESAAAATAAALQAASVPEPPPAYEPPVYEPPKYEAPHYDPPGTFDLAQFAAASVSPAPAAVEERRPDLEALQEFLSAVIAARETVRAR